MKRTPWEDFFRAKVTRIFNESKNIVDIGGGLRIAKDKNNRYSKKNEWILPLLKNVDYKVLDPVSDYNPDIIGDIHDLPFEDNSLDAIFCLAVLEHVKNPFKAAEEMYRVLKPGGLAYIFVPFLYYYHPMNGYYNDYWRFTNDGIDELFKDFSTVEKHNVRGAIETWVHLSPLANYKIPNQTANFLDNILNKKNTKQTSGFNIFLIK